MHAVRLHVPGGVENLTIEELAPPQPNPGEVLVDVHAAAITRDELDWTTDRLPAIPSYELSGVVSAVGPGVDTVAAGDEVFALTDFGRDGVAAEQAVVAATLPAPKPRTLGHVESAAVPLPALSAWQGLFVHGRLDEGMRVLILGAAGGVGHFATQLARARGAHVIGTASSGNASQVLEHGAHEVVDHGAEVDPVDLVFDTAGGAQLERAPALVRNDGRLVSVAEEPPADAGVEAVYFVVEPNRDQLIELARLIDDGAVRPAIDSVFALADARAAFERTRSRGKHGKVVLRVRND